jgi:hypothetical protein
MKTVERWPFPILWNGQVFNSYGQIVQYLATELSVTAKLARRVLKNRNYDISAAIIDLRQPRKLGKPVRYGGRTFPSRSEFVVHLAGYLGLPAATVQNHLYSSDWDIDATVAKLSRPPYRKQMRPGPSVYEELLKTSATGSIPITPRGESEPVTAYLKRLTRAIASTKVTEFNAMSEPAKQWFDRAAEAINERAEAMPLPPGYISPPVRRNQGIPVFFEGKYFPTRSDFILARARQLGMKPSEVSAALYAHNWDIAAATEALHRPKPATLFRLFFHGEGFTSIAAFGRFLATQPGMASNHLGAILIGIGRERDLDETPDVSNYVDRYCAAFDLMQPPEPELITVEPEPELITVQPITEPEPDMAAWLRYVTAPQPAPAPLPPPNLLYNPVMMRRRQAEAAFDAATLAKKAARELAIRERRK